MDDSSEEIIMAGWTNKPSAFIKVVKDDLVDKRKEITIAALQAVVSGSPVDTGAYKGNHRVSLDGEDLGYDANLRDSSGSETLSKGQTVAGSIATPFGESVIQNNAPHGESLENGHSMQAAQGVYGPAFAAVQERYTK